MKRALTLLAILAGGLALTTCLDQSAPPATAAGWLDVALETPNAGDGGIIFTVAGGPLDSLRTTYPVLYSEVGPDSSRRVLIIGALTSGVVAQIWVPDVRDVSAYTAMPLAAAALTGGDRGPTGYRLTVETPADSM